MILSVHQPNFIPWLGYFDKIAASDVFVILDEVQFPRGKSAANRNKIKTVNGVFELVVPISHPSGNNRISNYTEVYFSNVDWNKKILRTISQNYQKADFFSEIMPFLDNIFSIQNFCEMNVEFIMQVARRLKLNTSIYKLSELNDICGKNNELIINICQHLDADTYLSGQGAKKYNDNELYQNALIELKYQEFYAIKYKQQFGEFVPNLSIIDVLFNIGFEGVSDLIIKNYVSSKLP
jgi:hypothetical protein